jgi:hypothetical protein
MFEGKPPQAQLAAPTGEASDAAMLRELAWAELTSRLAAARDLRAALAEGLDGGEASFDATFARRIAAQREGKDIVNPEASANGKGAGRTGGGAPPTGNRGGARE